VVSVLLSAGAVVDTRHEVSAIRDDESESDMLYVCRIKRLLCSLLVRKAMQRWSLCCYRLELRLTLEIR
jgi:hypothetical protein